MNDTGAVVQGHKLGGDYLGNKFAAFFKLGDHAAWAGPPYEPPNLGAKLVWMI